MGSSRGNNTDLFERMAMVHLEAVFGFAMSLTRNGTAAEDLTQETFLNALRGFDSFQIGTNCKAWLFRICKNLFIDGYRSKVRRPQHQEIELAEPAALDPDFDQRAFEHGSIENEELFLDLFGDEVNRYLAELPEEFRRALLLCDLEGLAYEEIAEIMETPIGTVRSRISRARAHLRERLEEHARELGYLRNAHQDCDD